jgi:hypothetical protein
MRFRKKIEKDENYVRTALDLASVGIPHRLNMELDLPRVYLGSCVQL